MKNKIRFVTLCFLMMLGFSTVKTAFAQNDSPKVSVIIPVYKVEKYIKECLDSVINQTLKDIEIICVDDGSPDKSGEILDEYAKKDKRIIVVHQENKGSALARQIGMDIAKGEYIKFVDSDDYLDLKTCEICYNEAKKDDVDILYHGSYAFTKDKKWVFREYKDSLITKKQFRLIAGYGCFSLLKTDFLTKNNCTFRGMKNMCEDTCFNSICVPKARKIRVIPNILYYYRRDNASSICKTLHGKEKAIQMLHNLNFVYEDWEKCGYFTQRRAKIAFIENTLGLHNQPNNYEIGKKFMSIFPKGFFDKKTLNALPKEKKSKILKTINVVKKGDAEAKNKAKRKK